MRDLVTQTGEIFYLRNAFKVGGQRFCSGCFNRSFIHAARVKVANLLFIASLGCVPVFRTLFENFVELVAISFTEFVEITPTRKGCRDFMLLNPPTICVLEKISARRNTGVHVRDVKAVLLLQPGSGLNKQTNVCLWPGSLPAPMANTG